MRLPFEDGWRHEERIRPSCVLVIRPPRLLIRSFRMVQAANGPKVTMAAKTRSSAAPTPTPGACSTAATTGSSSFARGQSRMQNDNEPDRGVTRGQTDEQPTTNRRGSEAPPERGGAASGDDAVVLSARDEPPHGPDPRQDPHGGAS